MWMTGVAKASQVTGVISMRPPSDNVTPPRSVLMRFLVRSWEYRHPRAWAGFRFAAGIWNLFPGVLLLAYGYWVGVVPLLGSVLIFWTVYRLQQHSVHRVRELEQTRAHLVDDSAARLRRIERDLHDGAQAQMVAVAMKLGLAREKLGGTIDGTTVAGTAQTDLERVLELVDAAHRGTKEAITELRDLARGIHPPVLDHGLGAALANIGELGDDDWAALPTFSTASSPSGASKVLVGELWGFDGREAPLVVARWACGRWLGHV